MPNTMTDFVNEVIQHWKVRGRGSTTYTALKWMDGRIKELEAEVEANRHEELKKLITRRNDEQLPV